ncbi:MAG TPA: hypothetical protein VNW15_02795 [Rhizomicrobium sp.]|nr:hypothetical protein [Rhizomicrobium sp.]
MKLHAVAAAFLLGTATLGGGMMLMTAPAYAAVRAVVGEPLQQAMALANKGDYKGAMALVDKAGTASEKTAEEVSLIAQVKNYIGSKSGDISLGGAAAGKNKLASDYTARNYAGVIADGDALKKAGALDSTTAAVVAQAYYLSGNKAGCIKYIQTDVGSAADEPTLQLLMKCAFDTNDSATQRNALEQLVAKTGKGEYWTQLIKMQETAKGLTDTQSLQLYRLKFLTGTLAGKDDYINMAQLDLQLGLPAEASTVLDKGMAAGLLNDDRSKKLQALAKQQSAQVVSGMAAAQAAADKDPSGDAQVKVALQQYSTGAFKDAVATAKSAVAKNLKDKDSGVIALGLAQVGAGQTADAIKTLNADKGDGNGPQIAHLYSLYASHPKAAAAATPDVAPAKKK